MWDLVRTSPEVPSPFNQPRCMSGNKSWFHLREPCCSCILRTAFVLFQSPLDFGLDVVVLTHSPTESSRTEIMSNQATEPSYCWRLSPLGCLQSASLSSSETGSPKLLSAVFVQSFGCSPRLRLISGWASEGVGDAFFLLPVWVQWAKIYFHGVLAGLRFALVGSLDFCPLHSNKKMTFNHAEFQSASPQPPYTILTKLL